MDEQLPITRRQFHILLNQIQMTDDDLSRYFEEGEIVKLTVHKATKTWHFLLNLRRFCLTKYTPCFSAG